MSDKNKKIAIIIERAEIALGGAERSIFELANALSARGFNADILAAKGRAVRENVHILCLDRPSKRVRHSTFATALKKYLAKNHYDIIHSTLPFDFADVYQPRGGTYAESVLRNAASYQNKLVAYYKKTTAFANLRRTILLRAEKKLCRNPAGPLIAALSKYVSRQFKQHYNVDAKRIVVVPNGVETDKSVDKDDVDRLGKQILAKLGLGQADDPVLFLFAANNFRLKGLSYLIKAMQTAKPDSTDRQVCLIVIGSGRIDKYRRLAQKLSIREKIVFLGAVTDIKNVLPIAHVAVLPTFCDASSRFILEALAAGKPVITTKFNGAADMFVNHRHGKIIDNPEDITALAQAIGHFTNIDNLRKASQAIVADNVKEQISISRAVQQLESVYESILQRRPRK